MSHSIYEQNERWNKSSSLSHFISKQWLSSIHSVLFYHTTRRLGIFLLASFVFSAEQSRILFMFLSYTQSYAYLFLLIHSNLPYILNDIVPVRYAGTTKQKCITNFFSLFITLKLCMQKKTIEYRYKNNSPLFWIFRYVQFLYEIVWCNFLYNS